MTQLNEESINERLGVVVDGSLNKGLEVRLDGSSSVEDMAVGRYVTIPGKKQKFFGMVTDVMLAATDQRLTSAPPDISDPFISEVLSGTSAYGMLHITPYLTMDLLRNEPQTVKTIPSHFCDVKMATDADIELVFGKEDEKSFFIGNPLEMETKLCVDLEAFVKRSNGIFGKSGTGKTFLTRLLLIGMLQKSKAANLIFDMHNEYGWEGTFEGGKSKKVKALKQLFPSKVAVCTLDEENSRRRGVKVDFTVRIGYNEIEPEDISLLRQTLNLTDQAVEAVYQLRRRFGKNWFTETMAIEDSEDIGELNIHEATFQNLRRGLSTIERLPFISADAPDDAVSKILEYIKNGTNVVLEFGRHRDITSYILVANMLTRRIYSKYQKETEQAMADDTTPPTPLVITIEEAHKFLNPEVAQKTIFGTIAREMRKYNVSLLVIDQRPSGIDEEVMSQLGTKITCLLDNERDVDAVLAGVSGKSALKSVIARLAAKQQSLMFGHSVPMPVAFTPREYGSEESYKDFMQKSVEEKDIEELFG